MQTKILEYINFENFISLLEGCNQATGFVTAMLDDQGKTRNSKVIYQNILRDGE